MSLGPFKTRRGRGAQPVQPQRDASRGARRDKQAHRGFTLIEVLVVVAIIAILVGLVLSVLTRVRGAQKSVKCIANLKGIGEAFSAYVHDNQGRYPDPGRADLSW